MKKRFLIPVILALLLCATAPPPRFTSMLIGEEEFTVEIADTPEKKALGLMFRKEIPANFGMLFIYADEDHRGIWMKNTLIHLDLVFLDGEKEVIQIIPDVPPCKADPCATYVSEKKAKYVLEIRGKRAGELGLKTGDRLFFILSP